MFKMLAVLAAIFLGVMVALPGAADAAQQQTNGIRNLEQNEFSAHRYVRRYYRPYYYRRYYYRPYYYGPYYYRPYYYGPYYYRPYYYRPPYPFFPFFWW